MFKMIGVCAALLCATAFADDTITVLREPGLVNGWTVGQRVGGFKHATVRFSVKEQNMDEIISIVKRVSDPASPDYGNYLKQAEIDAIVAPKQQDMDAVLNWLNSFAKSSEDFSVSVEKEVITLDARADLLEELLDTELYYAEKKGERHVVRARDIAIPSKVFDSIQAVYGLHGLPLPKRKNLRYPPNVKPVTPEVLKSAYMIEGVMAKGSIENRQAVAEFQGQTMNDADLVEFFTKYLPSMKEDAKVYKHVGDKCCDNDPGQVEANLDIQYIMGVAPKVKTEFWYFESSNFCAGLKNWTSLILKDDKGPLVHSVSYGYQGNLTTGASLLGCMKGDVEDIDNAFAKIAAKGITIIFASGDSGSGYVKPNVNICSGPTNVTFMGKAVANGTLSHSYNASSPLSCCYDSEEYEAYSFYPPKEPENHPYADCQSKTPGNLPNIVLEGGILLKEEVFGSEGAQSCCNYAQEYSYSKGWSYEPPVGAYCGSPTMPGELKNKVFTGEALLTVKRASSNQCCTLASEWPNPPPIYPPPPNPGPRNAGWSYEGKENTGPNPDPMDFGNCTIWYRIEGEKEVMEGFSHRGVTVIPRSNCTIFKNITGVHERPGSMSHDGGPKPPGVCRIYKTASKHLKTKKGVVTGGAMFTPGPRVELYPSWPAISPWVTSVGSTRFIDANASKGAEMSTDQFGSGGGFSWYSNAFEAQEKAVEEYFKVAPQLPPMGSYRKTGRATPDVSAMGEGFQVIINKEIETVGGTSASAPTFAAIVSLLNEARLDMKMKPMGYLNPFLYAHPTALTDIVKGNNAIGRGPFLLPYGFNCTKGWDPSSGLGTPIFTKLKEAALAAGEKTKTV